MKGKDLFKKIHPSIYEKQKKDFKFKLNEKLKLNFDYNKIVSQSEGKERYGFDKRMNIKSANLDEILNKNIIKNKNEQKINIYNSLDKTNIFTFKRKNELYDINNENDNYYFKFEKDLNKYEKYILKSNNKNININNIIEYDFKLKKNSENMNIDKILNKKDFPKLLNYIKDKEKEKKSFNDNKYQNINSPNKISNIFHSLDIGHSSLISNSFKEKKDKKYFDSNNKYQKKLTQIFQFEPNLKNSFENQRTNIHHNLTPKKHYIIKKTKTNKDNKRADNKNNTTNILEKYNPEEEKNNIIETKYKTEKRKKFKYFNFNSLNILNNYNNTEINIDNDINNKIRHISGLSFNNQMNNNFIEELKLKKQKMINKENNNSLNKDNNSILNKYFKLNNNKTSKKNVKTYNYKNNYINTINHNLNKYYLNFTIDKENDKNYNNQPLVTINNMNYNFNLYEPKIHLSAFHTDNQIKTNKFPYNKNTTIKIFNNSKIKKYFIKKLKGNNNKYENKTHNNKKQDKFMRQNCLTQEELINNDFFKKNYKQKTFHINNYKNMEKLNSFMKTNKKILFDNSKEKKNNTFKPLLSTELTRIINNNEKNNNNERQNENSMGVKYYKKIRTIRKSDMGPDLLYKLRQKRKEKINEEIKQNVFSPCITYENNNKNNNMTLSINATIRNNKNIINYYNKKKNNKNKIKNRPKKNVINSLIKDFLNLTNISNKENISLRYNCNICNAKS